MRLWSNLEADIAFILTRNSERPGTQTKWFNALIKTYTKTTYEGGFGTDGLHPQSDFQNKI